MGDRPRNKNASLTMLFDVCGDIIGEESKAAKEEISVNEDNEGHTIFPADLFNTLFGPTYESAAWKISLQWRAQR